MGWKMSEMSFATEVASQTLPQIAKLSDFEWFLDNNYCENAIIIAKNAINAIIIAKEMTGACFMGWKMSEMSFATKVASQTLP